MIVGERCHSNKDCIRAQTFGCVAHQHGRASSDTRLHIPTIWASQPDDSSHRNLFTWLADSIVFETAICSHTTMATITTTATTLERAPNTILADYELHHSSAPSENRGSETSGYTPAEDTPQPAEWDTRHRRVPAYRPVNRDRDQADVRVYLSNAERAFVTVMFTGLFVNAVGQK